jgi:hypothetical protein
MPGCSATGVRQHTFLDQVALMRACRNLAAFDPGFYSIAETTLTQENPEHESLRDP